MFDVHEKKKRNKQQHDYASLIFLFRLLPLLNFIALTSIVMLVIKKEGLLMVQVRCLHFDGLLCRVR